MIFGTYYLDQRHMIPLALIRRERLLPEDADGRIEVKVGNRVSLHDVIARAELPAPYVLVDAAKFFRLRKPDDVIDLLKVDPGDRVERGEVIAVKGRRKLKAPIDGRFMGVEEGLAVFQEIEETLNLLAGLNGQVIEVKRERGVVIETSGAVLQGVWGNGKSAVGTLKIEPVNGLEQIRGDLLEMQFRGALVVTRGALTQSSLQLMDEFGISGIIAPGFAPSLLPQVIAAPGAVLITEGFGAQRMSSSSLAFLDGLDGQPATLDAHMPAAPEPRRPELIVNVALRSAAHSVPPQLDATARPGLTVRVTSGTHAGAVGRISSLPKTPQMLDNGLRVVCASVELTSGERVTVPLANIEFIGQ